MEALEDIRRRLQENQYRNEEHVRLSLVARVLQEYGWDIWDPTEVDAEFTPVPQEDRTKVDIALVGPANLPLVFIEVKPVGGIRDRGQTERQLRDYNRNNTAPFCIITDGQTWHFYYSLTPGQFGDKRFKTVDLLQDDLADVGQVFSLFLAKDGVQSENARQQADRLLSLNRAERILAECLPEARRIIQRPPFPSLPEALAQLAEQRGIAITRERAAAFIERAETAPPPTPPAPTPPPHTLPLHRGGREVDPDHPPDLSHTTVTSASIGGETAHNWNDLVAAGIRLAWQRGHRNAGEIRAYSGANIRAGRHTAHTFRPVQGTGFSFQYVQASRAWEIALRIARNLGVPIVVEFKWRDHPDAAHPGQSGTVRWNP